MNYPYIETLEDYQVYKEAYEEGCKSFSALSLGLLEGCSQCPEYDEGKFTYNPCDICNRQMGGDKYPAHARERGDTVHLDICLDCEFYTEYGRLDDETMATIHAEPHANDK